MKELFKLAGTLSTKKTLLIEILGILLLLLVWFLLTYPQKQIILSFNSDSKKLLHYSWEGQNNLKEDYWGANILKEISTGKYTVQINDSNRFSHKAEIVIPSSFKDTMSKIIPVTVDSEPANIYIDVKIVSDGYISKAILPTPQSVFLSYKELHFKDYVVLETGYSFIINFLGYIEAIILSILFGFAIGLIPFFRALLSRWVNAIRFVPLTAVTGLFIAWFGIETNMKVQFLAFGILVYLLPVVVQRIDEIGKIYLQTAYTLGATNWQQIRYVYWPSVASRIIDDIRVLTAISWTYIIIAEMLNQTGGVGALIHLAGRQGKLDKVFALLIIIVIIGLLQDRLFVWLDKKLFPYKQS